MDFNFDKPKKRRFFQLQALISFYVPDFDDRKIWFYGCNCLMDNDRPMSAPGYGKPTDRNGFMKMRFTIFLNCISVSMSGAWTWYSCCTNSNFMGNEVCVIMIMGMINALNN